MMFIAQPPVYIIGLELEFCQLYSFGNQIAIEDRKLTYALDEVIEYTCKEGFEERNLKSKSTCTHVGYYKWDYKPQCVKGKFISQCY